MTPPAATPIRRRSPGRGRPQGADPIEPTRPRLVPVDAGDPDEAALAEAGALIRRGGLVAFPTESFYGLGADALDPGAVDRVFQVKGRPAWKPVLVVVNSIAMAEQLAPAIPARVRDLMARHWPGALTIVLPAAPRVPRALTGGTGTIGIRVPAHPVARALAAAAGRPVTAPSANPSRGMAPTTAGEVLRHLGAAVDVILDAGRTAGGSGSTVADCTAWPPRIVRQGPVALDEAVP